MIPLGQRIRVAVQTGKHYKWYWSDSIYEWKYQNQQILLMRHAWAGSVSRPHFKRPQRVWEMDVVNQTSSERDYYWAYYWDHDFETFINNLGLEVPERNLELEAEVPSILVPKGRRPTTYKIGYWINCTPWEDGYELDIYRIYNYSSRGEGSQRVSHHSVMYDSGDFWWRARNVKDWHIPGYMGETIFNLLTRNKYDEAYVMYSLL